LSYEINSMSFITKTFSNVNKQLHTVDHHSLEYGPSNKNLFQTMGVFHTMGGKKIIFFYTPISVVVGTLISVVVATLFLGVPT